MTHNIIFQKLLIIHKYSNLKYSPSSRINFLQIRNRYQNVSEAKRIAFKNVTVHPCFNVVSHLGLWFGPQMRWKPNSICHTYCHVIATYAWSAHHHIGENKMKYAMATGWPPFTFSIWKAKYCSVQSKLYVRLEP